MVLSNLFVVNLSWEISENRTIGKRVVHGQEILPIICQLYASTIALIQKGEPMANPLSLPNVPNVPGPSPLRLASLIH